MPLYDYRCAEGHDTTLRRLIAEREASAACGTCGKAAAPVFSPNSHIFVPISFRQVLTRGELGGGGLSWSDFHDVSEKELAKNPNVVPFAEAMSQPSPKRPKGISMGEAFKTAKEKLNV